MFSEPPSHPVRFWHVAAVGAASAVLAAVELRGGRGLVHDDPYILYRYARNLATGHGWAYNPGSTSSGGATSPLYVLVLALLYMVGFSMTAASTLVFGTGLVVATTAIFAALARIGRITAGVVAGALAITSPWILQTRGMETALVLALLGLSACAFAFGRPALTGLALGFLCLARPDELVFAGVFLAGSLAFGWARLWRTAAPLAAVVGAWLIYAAIAVGQVVPDTLTAKVDQTRSGYFGHGLLFMKGFWYILRYYGMTAAVAVLYILGAAGLAVLAWRRDRRDWTVFGPLVGGSVLLVIAYGLVLNVPYFYDWYYAPVVFTLAAAGGLAVEIVVRAMTGSSLVHLGAALAAVAGLAALGLRYPLSLGYRASYIPAALWVHDHSPQSASLAADEIGIVGWYSQRPIVDYLGLLSPEAARQFAARHALWWIEHYQPDYWIMVEKPGSTAPLYPFDVPVVSAPWFPSTFRAVFSNPVVIVYERVGQLPFRA